MNSVGDALTVSVVQSFEDDDIVRAFCKVCDENGPDVTCRDMGIIVLFEINQHHQKSINN